MRRVVAIHIHYRTCNRFLFLDTCHLWIHGILSFFWWGDHRICNWFCILRKVLIFHVGINIELQVFDTAMFFFDGLFENQEWISEIEDSIKRRIGPILFKNLDVSRFTWKDMIIRSSDSNAFWSVLKSSE